MKKTDLNTECKDLEFIIDNLVMGKESYEIEDTRYNLEEGIEFLRGFLQELKGLNNQIIEQGNTPELLKKIYEKYTELWLFQLYIHVDSLPVVIGGLMRYPNYVE